MELPEEHELISVFECIPSITDEGIPFFYNTATYEFLNFKNQLFMVEISPAYGDVKIQVTERETQQVLAHLEFKRAFAFEIIEDNKETSTVAVICERQQVTVQLKPRFFITIQQDNPE